MTSTPGVSPMDTRGCWLQHLATFFLGLIFAGSAVAAPPPVQHPPQTQTPKTTLIPAGQSKVEQQLNVVQQAWINAEIQRDGDALRRILSPKFVFTFGVRAPESRDSFIHAVLTARTNMKSQTLSETTTVIDRDTAVIAGLDTVRGTVHGKPYKAVYRYMATYVRRNGRWIALAEHLAPVPDKN